ncbi:hypothetical protein C4D60_Mb06t15590 [Musa balbisiana]|uniref:Ubiquitin thioesterase OTU n=1 Tax=Musa balbisiana TaxID=52838 RepID=A0A4S8INF9_MUSBA|nr:hypothetical protein C4D60_Mb06t15590 [Musa balbisiana]
MAIGLKRPSNEVILGQLRDGSARSELLPPPDPVPGTDFGLMGGHDALNSRIAGGLTTGGALHGSEGYRRRPLHDPGTDMFAGPLAGHRSLLGIDYLTRDATVDWLGHTATVVVSSTIHEGFHGEPLQSSFERGLTGAAKRWNRPLRAPPAAGCSGSHRRSVLRQDRLLLKVKGDGRCMFRALVKGMANNKGLVLNPRQETDEADDLRMAVKEVICDGETERPQYEEALIAITVDESLKRYCQRIERSDFWGGESELLVLSKLCQQPIIVYIPEHEHTHGTWGNGFIPITQYGSEFGKKLRNGKQKAPVRLLFSGRNHYDLLV